MKLPLATLQGMQLFITYSISQVVAVAVSSDGRHTCTQTQIAIMCSQEMSMLKMVAIV